MPRTTRRTSTPTPSLRCNFGMQRRRSRRPRRRLLLVQIRRRMMRMGTDVEGCGRRTVIQPISHGVSLTSLGKRRRDDQNRHGKCCARCMRANAIRSHADERDRCWSTTPTPRARTLNSFCGASNDGRSLRTPVSAIPMSTAQRTTRVSPASSAMPMNMRTRTWSEPEKSSKSSWPRPLERALEIKKGLSASSCLHFVDASASGAKRCRGRTAHRPTVAARAWDGSHHPKLGRACGRL